MVKKIPEKGSIVLVQFSPIEGHEQGGKRPALVLSSYEFNKRTPFLIVSPITSKVKNYPFEVPFPEGLKTKGVVLSDQIRTIDWHSRTTQIVGKAPVHVVEMCQRNQQLIMEMI